MGASCAGARSVDWGSESVPLVPTPSGFQIFSFQSPWFQIITFMIIWFHILWFQAPENRFTVAKLGLRVCTYQVRGSKVLRTRSRGAGHLVPHPLVLRPWGTGSWLLIQGSRSSAVGPAHIYGMFKVCVAIRDLGPITPAFSLVWSALTPMHVSMILPK